MHQQTLPAEVCTGIPTHHSYPKEEVEKVYEEIDNIIINSKSHYNIVMRDFNAKVGSGEIRETCAGLYGIGTRNTRSDMLVEFAE